MYHVQTDWFDTSPPPPLRIDATTMQADEANGYLFRSLIASAEMFGKPWLAVTFLPPGTRRPAGARSTVWVGEGCTWLGIGADGDSLTYARA